LQFVDSSGSVLSAWVCTCAAAILPPGCRDGRSSETDGNKSALPAGMRLGSSPTECRYCSHWQSDYVASCARATCFDMLGIHQEPHLQARPLQKSEKTGNPVHPGGLHGYGRDATVLEPAFSAGGRSSLKSPQKLRTGPGSRSWGTGNEKSRSPPTSIPAALGSMQLRLGNGHHFGQHVSLSCVFRLILSSSIVGRAKVVFSKVTLLNGDRLRFQPPASPLFSITKLGNHAQKTGFLRTIARFGLLPAARSPLRIIPARSSPAGKPL